MWVVAAKRVAGGLLVAAGLLLPMLTWANEATQPAQPIPQPGAEPGAVLPVQQAVAQTAQPSAPQPAHQPAAPPAQASPSSSVIPDLVYKGVVGKALDVVPMDPDNRRSLQRGNAVVSGTLAGRALGAALLGGANPVFGIVGLVWGMYSACQTKPEDGKAANGGGDGNAIAALPAAPRAVYEFPQAVSLARLAHLSVSDQCN